MKLRVKHKVLRNTIELFSLAKMNKVRFMGLVGTLQQSCIKMCSTQQIQRFTLQECIVGSQCTSQ